MDKDNTKKALETEVEEASVFDLPPAYPFGNEDLLVQDAITMVAKRDQAPSVYIEEDKNAMEESAYWKPK